MRKTIIILIFILAGCSVNTSDIHIATETCKNNEGLKHFRRSELGFQLNIVCNNGGIFNKSRQSIKEKP